MLLLSGHVDQWLGDKGEPNIGILTLLFFSLNFLAATQDIAVDGWALTMLKKCNVGHASTCNSVGQTAGFFLSYVLFMALESPTFCNSYLRSIPQPEGICLHICKTTKLTLFFRCCNISWFSVFLGLGVSNYNNNCYCFQKRTRKI